jgi:hypothetical protein
MNYILRLCAFFCALFLSVPVFGALLYQQDFESGIVRNATGIEDHHTITPDGKTGTGNFCYYKPAFSFNRYESVNVARTGTKAIRVENRGDSNYIGAECGYTEKKHRVQFRPWATDDVYIHSDVASYAPMGSTRWYGVSFYYPEGSDGGTIASWWGQSNLSSFFQIMSVKPSNHTPEVFLRVGQNGALNLQNYYTESGSSVEKTRSVDQGAFRKGSWNDVVVQHKRATDNTGILKIWVNGTLLVNYVNMPVSITGQIGAYPDYGHYWGTVHRPGQIYVTYVDSIKVGDATSSYDEVKPGATVLNPVTTLDSVNGGTAVSQTTLTPFAATTTDSFVGCKIGTLPESYVNWDYTGNASGYFNSGDISSLASSTQTIKCFHEAHLPPLDVTASAWASANETEAAYSAGSRYGYTTGMTITKSGALEYGAAYLGLTNVITSVPGDKHAFDFTYSCLSTNCDNLYFSVDNESIGTSNYPRLTLEGSAGLLTQGTLNSGFGADVVIANRTLGDNVHRARLQFTATVAATKYKIRAGTRNAADGHVMALHEVIPRKNWTTQSVQKQITTSRTPDDTTAPVLSGCAMDVAPNAFDTYTASISCTTTELGGDAYVVIKTTNSPPADSDAVIAATGAAWSASAPVDSTTISFESGGWSYQDLWAYAVHRDAATNKSTVATATFDATNKALQLGTIADPIMRGSVPLPSATYATVTIYSGNKAIDPTATVVTALQNVPVVNGVATGREEHVIPGQPSLNSIPNGTYWVLSSRPSGATYALSYGQRAIVTE